MSTGLTQDQSITELLRDWSVGKTEVLDDLLPLVHSELHRQAHNYLRHERPGHTLQTTALINEAFLKLTGDREVKWESRSHFFAIAAKAMRQVLIEYARKRDRLKRGGNPIRISLDENIAPVESNKNGVDLIALDEALGRLEEIDPGQVRLVELRFFSGMTLEETAAAMKVSRSTVAREWKVAKIWLYRELSR